MTPLPPPVVKQISLGSEWGDEFEKMNVATEPCPGPMKGTAIA
jgi:hypothetical protein